MKKKLTALLLVIAILSAASSLYVSAKPASETFVLFIEAEDCSLDGYTIVDGKPGSVGKVITADTANEQFFTANFTLPADGTYFVWLKVWHSSQGDNSVFYEYDGDEHVFDFDEAPGEEDPDYFMYNRWYWMRNGRRGDEPLANGWSEWGEANNQCRHTPVPMNLKAGANSITFKCREAFHFIDQVVITDDADYNPADIPGNETYVCGFCNMEHFKKEPFADFGKTPEQYYLERLAAENPPPEPEPAPEPAAPADPAPAPAEPAPAPAPAPTPVPQTSDDAVIVFALLCLAVCGAAAIRSKTKRI
ncbi:MAG: hypothetical protein FWD23_05235 [Oscillospiraceae bacterium]|nr:hypothetical protein [Oscillospiraceae bacterium]